MLARMRIACVKAYQFLFSRWRPLSAISITFGCLLIACLSGCHMNQVGMLNPKGIVAFEERKLLFDTLALMLIVVLPVIVMSLTFVFHYQASHKIKDYKPNWSHSVFLESLWWGIPCVIIIVLAIITWKKTHSLDPYQPIAGQPGPSMVIHAIALPWKWLFIYPEQNIATVNYLMVPVGHDVEYWLTTDNVPMSAFFVPQIGSQIYAMAGMRTRLHLLATSTGVYDGFDSQYNGSGFSDMHFPVYVVDDDTMQSWIKQVKKSSPKLTDAAYIELLKPTTNAKAQFYSGVDPNFFNNVVEKYMSTYGTEHPRQQLGVDYNIN